MRGLWMIGFAVCLITGCNLDNAGTVPPTDKLYFPVSVAVSPTAGGDAPSYLYVANANFDLRYNAGWIQTLDLDAIEAAMPDDCTDCDISDLSSVVVSNVRIGSQATDMAVSTNGERLYVTVREDANLTTVNVDSATGELACGGDGSFQECSSRFREMNERSPDGETHSVSGEPVVINHGSIDSLQAGAEGEYILLAHRSGRITLLADGIDTGDGSDPKNRVPFVVDTLGGFPRQLYGLRFDPATSMAWVTNAYASTVTRVGIAFDRDGGQFENSHLYSASAPAISGVDDGSDTRDVIFDEFEDGRRRAYLLSRRPEAILVASMDDGATPQLKVERAIDIGLGPSRFEMLKADVGGTQRTLLFASCYSSRDIYVVDPVRGELEAVIHGANGPFDMALDPVRMRMYVADFRASALRVVTLAPLFDCLENGASADESCAPRVLGTIGEATIVGGLF
ncbi:MAG: hypothetical protein R3A78_14745 [Polyangiales bacterium]|nr:hypothetical protein [Myxococcales bacterium]